LGFGYIDALKEKDPYKRIAIRAKVEDRERRVRELEEKQTFKEYVTAKHKEYDDTLFWIAENSKNTTTEIVKRFTIKERVNFVNRLIAKIDAENRRSNRQGEPDEE